jgi:hypothetical protein
MSMDQVEKRGTNVSVTFNLQTLEEATGLAELLARQLKEGELHLRLASKARLVIDVPQSGAIRAIPTRKTPHCSGIKFGKMRVHHAMPRASARGIVR